ncbi:MAG: hypothetical protein COU28_04590 [Candidatus Magasanikbacteria bacterium CG10_big_fil_rev_8_21_14_0_10_36_16]|uniref:Thymidylate kinase-like domain-containing protein n=1 Tax=Candidatus Magasanikbacteria bacterium CG10_big_fil_rev_8_21_14_0_10_36_16 TaxID=1974645 RepID=A0A2H0TZ82_9BACT|nr:MAG: hypothetical protein COU28_04590 [Candidatus Magasanikbacteria bacterium CG10_big_fil_rev_8_21_14_0_10_36_16]
MKKGLFVVLHGINNLGKTTQAKLLVEKLQSEGHKAEYMKYPVYDLDPSGKILNNYLREGNKYNLAPREIQTIYALNRTQYESTLKEKLESGVNIIAEDYTGTGICWGIGAGVDEEYLKLINSHLLKEDLDFLFDGERFTESTEKNHKHETDEELLEKVRQAHLRIGEELDWKKINANLTIPEIHAILWEEIKKLI